MTQTALATAAHTTQPNVAAVEAGARAASPDMLMRLLNAAGYRPAVSLATHRSELLQLGSQLGFSNIRVFGSVARNTDTIDSDIDLLVDYPMDANPFGIGHFAARAEALLGFSVDVVVDEGDRPEVAAIRTTAVPL